MTQFPSCGLSGWSAAQSKAVWQPPVHSGHHRFAQHGGGRTQKGTSDLAWAGCGQNWGSGVSSSWPTCPKGEKERPSCDWAPPRHWLSPCCVPAVVCLESGRQDRLSPEGDVQCERAAWETEGRWSSGASWEASLEARGWCAWRWSGAYPTQPIHKESLAAAQQALGFH